MLNSLKLVIKNNFQYFSYFYSYLRYRLLISLLLSLFVGVLDGLGLAMFLPLLQMIDGSNNINHEQLGSIAFLLKGFDLLGVSISITSVLITMLIFFSLKGVFKFFEGYVRVVYQQYFIKRIRLKNINLMVDYSYINFVKADSGRIQNSFTGEVERVNQAYRSYFTSVQYAILVLVYVFLAFLTNAQFAILVAIGGLLTNYVFKRLYVKTKKLSKDFTLKNHQFQGLLIQKINYFKYLKSSGLIRSYASKLKNNIEGIEQDQKRIGVLGAILQSVREPLVISVVVIVIIVQLTFFGESLSLIILSLLFFYRSLTYLMAMQNYWNTFLGVSGSLENMTQFSKELKNGKESNGELIFNGFYNTLNVCNVSFGYNDNLILKDVSVDIEKNRTIAFIGESGSGKTTLMDILAGLIPPSSGDIILDGVNLREMNLSTYQSRIGYITQEPVIFNDTIFNNVTFWSDKSPDSIKRFNEATSQAAIFTYIDSLPDKEDSMLGINGVNLSGGQKQRISIARELYKKLDFLFLDEATSALDTETESAIQENIDLLKGQYTIIVIAHRLTTIKNADYIVLLKDGGIESAGNFSDLYSKSSLFKKMVELQNF